ncbi:zf-HC2 domain-containing protein [Kineosporia sp. J2-2]|uniref:Zf-HC2 domain-containing protein n=1 Tax=Kineosporia corallincola TaxID=2835133 RepID=A0ABS5TH36_9ACTN|nr:zf-HC2 domain-containing protein [Kineosporia corallincola]MBT0770405.1 zf-HC2 domain-containing protein [Kineosporia corallincola]
MSHLGGRLSELVDGELEGAAADRALRHLADCRDCRDALEIERLMKQRLASLVVPEPGDDLLRNLLDLGGPAGPLPPRREHVPGSPRPAFVSPGAGLRPAGRHDVRVFAAPAPPSRGNALAGQRRARLSRPQRRVAATLVGAACLVGAGVAGGVASHAVSAADVVTPVDSFVVRHIATTNMSPFSSENSWTGLGGR